MKTPYRVAREKRIAEVYSRNPNIFKLPLAEYEFKNPVAALTFFSFENQVSLNTLTGRSVVRCESNKRRDAMKFLFCVCPNSSVVELARLFERDHTTMLYAVGISTQSYKKVGSPIKQRGLTISLGLGLVSEIGNAPPRNQVAPAANQFAAE